MPTRHRPHAARPTTTKSTRSPRNQPAAPNPSEDRTLNTIFALMNRLPKPYKRIPQPRHFLLKIATVARGVR